MSAHDGASVVEDRRHGSVADDTSNAEADGISQCLKGVGTFTIGDESNEKKTEPCTNSYKTRLCLPSPMHARNDVSIWNILKQCVGKELSKITMPVAFNEPLSFLQRMVEYLEYAPLLVKAVECENPTERLEIITAFAVSATSSNWERIGKPFNPLLGETYELDRPDLGFRIVCEQVSHHPPVSAFHAQSEHYMLHGSVHPKLKFWGKSVEVTPKGDVTLHLFKYGEVYTWQNVNCSINNVIVGKLWIENYGTLEVTNCSTKHKSVLNFKRSDLLGRDLHKIEGYLYDASQKKLRAFQGKWIEALYSYDVDVYENYIKSIRRCPSPSVLAFSAAAKVSEEIPSRGSSCNLNLQGQKLLWEAAPRPEHSSMYYNFTTFAITLNSLDASLQSILPPTDSRLRPDMRKMEQGDVDGAAEDKTRVEEKQRISRKNMKKSKQDWDPRWFKLGSNAYTGKEDWLYTGQYWQRSWQQCPDIF